MIQIYHNPRCAKSREALNILEDSGIPFTIIAYLQNPPKAAELKSIVKKLNGLPQELLRTKEPVYKEIFQGAVSNTDSIVKAIASYPILLERPLLVSDSEAMVARDPERILDFLKRNK
jgi:arsenate reductase